VRGTHVGASLRVEGGASSATHVAEQIASVKARLAVLRKKKRPSKAHRGEVVLVERELSALVNAPVSGGRDPFEWLPDELIVMIVLMFPLEVLWSGVCERVCQRWARLMESAPVKRHKRDGRWAAYEEGAIKPRELEGHIEGVHALAVGLDGKVYSGSEDKTIRVWSGTDSTHFQTLKGHTDWVGDWVSALAVGLDGKIYSGSMDGKIHVWLGDGGTHLQTLEGHAESVMALAVGLDGKVYSGSSDETIRVWSGTDGTHIQSLVGHTHCVCALAVGLDGKINYGSFDRTIHVWSAIDGMHFQTLVGHTHCVCAPATGLNGSLYSGSSDKTIRVWSGDDGTHLHTLVGHTNCVTSLAVGLDGKVFSGTRDEMLVWSCNDGTLLHKLGRHLYENALAVRRDGSLISSSNKRPLVW
jgi:WD40 repeat protein